MNSLPAVIRSVLNTFLPLYLCCFFSTFALAEAALQPYSAVYGGTIKGINAELQQQLTTTGDNHWQLNNQVSILFTGFEEQAIFQLDQQQIIPSRYFLDNGLSKKRNSQLRFDWAANTVFDALHSQQALSIPIGSLDKLSFQSQLRLDLMSLGDQFGSKQYHLIDRNKYKTYTVSYLGAERIKTTFGILNTVKIEQRRQGKDKHTLIWLAQDWDYFVLRVQRVEQGKPNYQVDLKQADINGRPIQSIATASAP